MPLEKFDPENATRNPQLSLKITFHFYMKKERLPHHRDSLFHYQVLNNYSSNMISMIWQAAFATEVPYNELESILIKVL